MPFHRPGCPPLTAGLVLCARAKAVVAQTAPIAAPARNAQSAQPSSVSITANKRDERLRDVLADASVVQVRRLEQQRIVTIDDLSRAASTLSGGGNGLSIRGIGANSSSLTAEGAVGVLIDSVSLGGTSETSPSPFEVERVDLLAGPQSTHFGKNSSAGIVNIVSVARTF